MQKSSVIRRSHELKDINWSVRVGRESVAQIRVKVRQTRTINNKVQAFLQAARAFATESEPGLRHVAFNDLNFLTQKIRQPIAKTIEQRIEHRRVFHHLLETALRRIRLLLSN